MSSLSVSWKIIKQSFKFGYDNLGVIVLVNIGWFFGGLFPLFISSIIPENAIVFVVALVLSVLLLGPASAAGSYCLHRLVNKESLSDSLSIKDFKDAFIKYFGRGMIINLFNLLVFFFLVFNFSYCAESSMLWLRLISGLLLYLMLFFTMIVQYVFPLLVKQDLGVVKAYKRATLVALDNLLISIVLLIVSIVISFISVYTLVPILIFWFSLLGLLQHFALKRILTKYQEDTSGSNN